MVADTLDQLLLEQVATRIREMTYGRIRNLAVEEDRGTVVVRGLVPSHHLRQLALKGALELLPEESCRACITVG